VTDAPGTARIKKRIGVLPQDFNALRRLTVRENLELFAAMYDNPASVNELIEVFGLQEKAKARFDALSGGLKQRVGVARLLLTSGPRLSSTSRRRASTPRLGGLPGRS